MSLANKKCEVALQATAPVTSILLDVDDGVIVTLKPVTSTNDVEVVLKVSVLLVDTTCKTLPLTPAPLTSPVNAKSSAKFMLSDCILESVI
jgi:hypothetical protein